MSETAGDRAEDSELLNLDEYWEMNGSVQTPEARPLQLPLHRVSDLDAGEDQ